MQQTANNVKQIMTVHDDHKIVIVVYVRIFSVCQLFPQIQLVFQ